MFREIMNFSWEDENQIQLISNKCDCKQQNSLQAAVKTRELSDDLNLTLELLCYLEKN